jgi:deoxycytidylate deaminase
MKFLSGKEKLVAFKHLMDAAVIAKNSTCLRSKCGAKIVKDNKEIGRGFNSPPKNKKLEFCLKDSLKDNFKSDKTCCVHAEQRAISSALRNHPNKLEGSTLYFMRIDLDNKIIPAGKPYCTICSKYALDNGIKEWVLLHNQGIVSYNSEEYNDISFGLNEWIPKTL